MDFSPREDCRWMRGGDGFDDPLIQHRVGCCAREEGGLRSCGAHSGGYTEGRVYARHSRFGTQSCPISHTCPGSVLYGHLMPTLPYDYDSDSDAGTLNSILLLARQAHLT